MEEKRLNRDNICYHEVHEIIRGNIKYRIDVFGDGELYSATVGVDNDPDENNVTFAIGTTEDEAIELAVIKYQEELAKPLH